MRITVKTLEKHHACPRGVDAFEQTFPHGAAITEANIVKAMEADLDLWWFRSAAMPGYAAMRTYCRCSCPRSEKAKKTCCARYFMRGIRAMKRRGRKQL